MGDGLRPLAPLSGRHTHTSRLNFLHYFRLRLHSNFSRTRPALWLTKTFTFLFLLVAQRNTSLHVVFGNSNDLPLSLSRSAASFNEKRLCCKYMSVGRHKSKSGGNKTLCSLLLRHRHSWTQIHRADPFTQWSSSAIYSPPPSARHGAVHCVVGCARVAELAWGRPVKGEGGRKVSKIRWPTSSLYTSNSRPPETRVAMQPLPSEEACSGPPRCCTGLAATVSSGLLQTSCFPAVTVIFRVTAQSREGPHIKYRDVFGIKE